MVQTSGIENKLVSQTSSIFSMTVSSDSSSSSSSSSSSDSPGIKQNLVLSSKQHPESTQSF